VIVFAALVLGTGVTGGPVRSTSLGEATVHAADVDELWLVPDANAVAARAMLAGAVRDLAGGRAADALPAFTKAADDPALGPYARLYAARAYLALSRPADAARIASDLVASAPSGAVTVAALNIAIDAAAAVDDQPAVFTALQTLATHPLSASAATDFRLLQAAIVVSDRETAIALFRTLYFNRAGTPESADAIDEMQRIKVAPPAPSRATLPEHLGRAEKLFAAKKFTDARAAFVALRPFASGADLELADLRIGESDLFLKKHAAAATALRAYAGKASTRVPESEYHHLTAVKELGREAEYLSLVRAFVDRNADPMWSARALVDLSRYHVLADEDGKAAEVAADLYARFPQLPGADAAAWRSGWWAYKQGDYAEAIRVFESAAVAMRRADYRPGWLYWAARAHLELEHRDAAIDGFRRVIADYRNSYYGRAAVQEIERMQAAVRPSGTGPVSPARLTWPATILPSRRPANVALIEDLLAAAMYDEAIAELRILQTSGQGSPLVDATVAYALNRQGKLRLAITAMRRAYPQFMAEGGEALPQEILTVIFPLDHWDVLRAHASAKNLDPYLVAALVAQESTFQADVKSAANAWGLMQIIPATGRRYAASLGIRPFSTFRLVEPEVNVKIGTTYFAELLKRFGDEAAALAAYNAGPQRVVRWLADRQGFDRDEFIDDIPFPETQNYVKRIIGTVEDYRILYGNGRR